MSTTREFFAIPQPNNDELPSAATWFGRSGAACRQPCLSGVACRFAFGRSGVVRRFELGRSGVVCRQPCLSSVARHLAISSFSAARCPAPVSQLLPVALRFSIVRRSLLERGGRLFVANFPVEANFLRLCRKSFHAKRRLTFLTW